MVGGAGLLPSPQHMFSQAGGGQRPEVGGLLPPSGPYTRIGPFSMRERYFEEQERLGRLRIEYVYNDGQRQNLIWYAHYLSSVFILLRHCLRIAISYQTPLLTS